jgi:biotin carboxylase
MAESAPLPHRVLLLIAHRSYRTRAFLNAARKLGVDVVVGSNYTQPSWMRARRMTIELDFDQLDATADAIARLDADAPLDAVIGVDDDTTMAAAAAAEAIGLPQNPLRAVKVTKDKLALRRCLADAGLASPWFVAASIDDDAVELSRGVEYPCVIKPTAMSASRGVIRANSPEELVVAHARIAAMINADGSERRDLIIEGFIRGPEIALEGLMVRGELQVLAIFDKPDPLDGPFFEETIYVTPSRLSDDMQSRIAATVQRAAAAIGLDHGPLHAELRLGDDNGPFIIEVAGRSIGGLCSNALKFGTGLSLEEVIIRHAVGADVAPPKRQRAAAGAMMLPIPRKGVLKEFSGLDRAKRVSNVDDVVISITVGQPVVPLPEGDRYLGFVFATAPTPEEVVKALRAAHRRLTFLIGEPDDNKEDRRLCAGPLLIPLLPRAPVA